MASASSSRGQKSSTGPLKKKAKVFEPIHLTESSSEPESEPMPSPPPVRKSPPPAPTVASTEFIPEVPPSGPQATPQTPPVIPPISEPCPSTEPRIAIPIIEYRRLCHTFQALATSQSILTQQMTVLRAHQEQIIATQTQHTAILR